MAVGADPTVKSTFGWFMGGVQYQFSVSISGQPAATGPFLKTANPPIR
jgi:hypothetical protein